MVEKNERIFEVSHMNVRWMQKTAVKQISIVRINISAQKVINDFYKYNNLARELKAKFG